MDFFTLLILIVIGVLVIGAVIWWFGSRRSDDSYTDYGDGYVVYHHDSPVIKRRPTESRRTTSTQSSQINIVSELKSFQAHLLALEKRIDDIEYRLRVASSASLSNISDRSFQESVYPTTNARTFDEKTPPVTSSDFVALATDSYRRFSLDGLRNLPIEPVFVYLDVDESARGAAIGDSQRVFKESDNKQNAFVVFAKNEGEGWLFPNPRISYTESMGYVFPQLTFENFTDSTHSVQPMRVMRTGENTWETLAD
jgi:hypothetical protein